MDVGMGCDDHPIFDEKHAQVGQWYGRKTNLEQPSSIVLLAP
jgi:hypothetical protein